MQTNKSPATLGPWARRVWLLPLIFSLWACGGGGGGDSTAAAPAAAPSPAQGQTPAPAQTASIPESLQGQWETILTYVPPFISSPYGVIAQGDGSLGITFSFSADGRYRHDWNMMSAYYGGLCFKTGQWQETGTLSGAGPEFTFNPGHATYMQTDSCGEFRYVDPVPLTAANHTLTLEHDNTGWPLLRMSFPSGDLLLEKCRRCQ